MSNSFSPYLSNVVVFQLAHGSLVSMAVVTDTFAIETSILSGNEMISNRCRLYTQGK